jgi:hypothetical protein
VCGIAGIADIAVIAVIGKGKVSPLINTDDTDQKNRVIARDRVIR